MNRAIIFFFFLALNNSSFGQSILVFTEASSFFRGNRAANLSLGWQKSDWYISMGADYIYDVTRELQRMDYNKHSYALSNKVGYRVSNRYGVELFCGAHQKYSRFNLYHLDRQDYFPKGEILPYQKQYSKYTIMGYMEVMYKFNCKIFFSMQVAVGYATIFNDTYSYRPSYTLLDKYRTYIDFSYLNYHAEHEIAAQKNDAIAFQLNFTLGYSFGSHQ